MPNDLEKKLISIVKKRNIKNINKFIDVHVKKLDINYRDKKGKSLLLIACESKSADIVESICKLYNSKHSFRNMLDEAFIFCCELKLNYSAYHILNTYMFRVHPNEKTYLQYLFDIADNKLAFEIKRFIFDLLKELNEKLNNIKTDSMTINNSRLFGNLVYGNEFNEFDSNLLFEGLITFITREDYYSKIKNDD